MIKNIIFDFGDVFINLDKAILVRELLNLDNPGLIANLKALNDAYEIGTLGTQDFLSGLQVSLPGRSKKELKELWNAMLLDFPLSRLYFLESLSARMEYRLFLLSNTNELHISCVKQIMGPSDYNKFLGSFEKFYFSHEIGMRKPDAGSFLFVLEQNNLDPKQTLFIDDTLENINAANKLGIKTWHLKVGQEDVTELKSRL